MKDERPIPTQCNPNQASSITPTITSTIFGSSFFFQLQFYFGSQPWQLWQSRWEPGGSTCKLDYNNDFFRVLQYKIDLSLRQKKTQTSRMSLHPCWPILLCLPVSLNVTSPCHCRLHHRICPAHCGQIGSLWWRIVTLASQSCIKL